ncbi:MAG TPA: class I SAM-dependent methyltransferase, partial [Pirellulales bacterium]
RIFEPACGTGRLLYRFAEEGYAVSGCDLSEKAVAFCNERLKRKKQPETAFVGDMADFTLPEPVDLAFNMINSVRHLPSEKAAEAHIRCMANALAPGGLYVLGLHLTPAPGEDSTEEESWHAARGALAVRSRLWTISVDRKARKERVGMTFDVTTPGKKFRLADEMDFRTYTAQQIKKLIGGCPDLEWVETYDFAYDLSKPVVIDRGTQDVVIVMRKR